jgi:thiol-disulfide isomerase/thioredoxin
MTQRLSFLCLTLGLAFASAAEAAAPKAGFPAPGFELPELASARRIVSLKSMAGKVVLVDFWASWCPPCRKTLPQLGRMRSQHPSLVVLAVSVDADRDNALEFLKPRDSSVVFLHDAKKSVAEEYDLGGMPSLYLIDKKGALRYRHDGYSERDEKSIEAEIKALMEET